MVAAILSTVSLTCPLVLYFSHLFTCPLFLSVRKGGWSQPSCPAAGLNCSESLINFSAETEDISWLRASFGRSKGGDRLSQNLSNLIYSFIHFSPREDNLKSYLNFQTSFKGRGVWDF